MRFIKYVFFQIFENLLQLNCCNEGQGHISILKNQTNVRLMSHTMLSQI